MASEIELLRRAIAIGDELIRISDSVRQPLASVHIATGLDILRAHTELREAMIRGGAQDARTLSRTEDTPSEVPARDA